MQGAVPTSYPGRCMQTRTCVRKCNPVQYMPVSGRVDFSLSVRKLLFFFWFDYHSLECTGLRWVNAEFDCRTLSANNFIYLFGEVVPMSYPGRRERSVRVCVNEIMYIICQYTGGLTCHCRFKNLSNFFFPITTVHDVLGSGG